MFIKNHSVFDEYFSERVKLLLKDTFIINIL